MIDPVADLGPWPTPRQELLLTAALRRGEPARAAWRDWVADLDPDRLEEQIEPDSQWLMPLLYWNLRRDVTHPVLARCRNVYLHNWYKNNAMLHALAAAVRTAKPAVTPVLLKGAAMAVRYYDSPGARPFVAIDAWIPTNTDAGPGWPDHLRETCAFHDSPVPATAKDGLLDRTETVTVLGATCAVLDAADQLVHLCRERRSWDPRTGLIWMADATQVLRRSPDIDWGTVCAVASRLGLTHALSAMLDYVERFDVPVGTSVTGHARRRPA